MYLSFLHFSFFMVSCFGTVFSTECSCAARGSLIKNQLSAHSRQAPEILQWNEVGIYQSPHTQLPGGWTGPGQGGAGSTHLASHAGSLARCPQPGDTPFPRTGHCRCHLGLPWAFLSRQLGEAWIFCYVPYPRDRHPEDRVPHPPLPHPAHSPLPPLVPAPLASEAHHDAVGLVDGPQVDAAVVPSCRQQPPGAFAQHQ